MERSTIPSVAVCVTPDHDGVVTLATRRVRLRLQPGLGIVAVCRARRQQFAPLVGAEHNALVNQTCEVVAILRRVAGNRPLHAAQEFGNNGGVQCRVSIARLTKPSSSGGGVPAG